MKKKLLIALIVCLAAPPPGRAAAVAAANHVQAAQQESQLSDEQLDNLMAPIALYPDPLLAQLFPASTFVDQVEQASRWLRSNKDPNKVDQQPWDVSVKSLAHYPEVVHKMAEKLDWTTAVGQAYATQSAALMASIQRLRNQAKNAGSLVSNQQQKVVVEEQVIRIVPAQPQVIYVPTYNPQVVYVQQAAPSGPSTGDVVAASLIAFGAGLAIGAWLNNDCNWHSGIVYYHGWRGSGWISYSSVHVHHSNSFYVNSRYTNVNINRGVVNRNVNYNNITHYNNVHRNVNYNNVNRDRNVNNANRNVNNGVVNRNINTNDARLDDYRGRQTAAPATRNVTPSNSAFGGYGSGGEARARSERGRASSSGMKESRGSGSGRAARGDSAKGGHARAGRRK